MRLSRITCCTISALLGSGVAAQANEGINEHQPQNADLDQQPDLNQAHPSEKYQVAVAVVPSTASRIVPPETSLGEIQLRRSTLETTNLDLEVAAIAPSEHSVTDKVVQEINPQSPEFISEFEWIAVKDLESEEYQATEPEAPATMPEVAAIAPEPSLTTAPEVNQELIADESPQTLAVDQPRQPTIIAASGQVEDLVEQKTYVVADNELLSKQVFSRPVADLMADETGAIAKLPDESTMAAENINRSAAESDYLLSQNSRGLDCKSCTPVEPLVLPEVSQGASPALSIAIPVGFGADQNTVFLSSSYQAVTRTDGYSTFHSGLGVGLGNASKNVGVELSYTLDTNDAFGDGGFNAKLHKRFTPDFAGSLGWNGFLNTSRHDFEQSLYGSLTKVFRTRESLDKTFSRVAVTAGLGTNQFRSDAAVRAGNNDINAFGNITVRVARPVSFITEWSGQDLGIGLSIAPFKNTPLVITPAIRDIFDGNGSRFVLGIGLAKKF